MAQENFSLGGWSLNPASFARLLITLPTASALHETQRQTSSFGVRALVQEGCHLEASKCSRSLDSWSPSPTELGSRRSPERHQHGQLPVQHPQNKAAEKMSSNDFTPIR